MYMRFLGGLGRPYSVGTNNLIKNGAHLVTNSMDILEMYPEFLNRKVRIVNLKKNKIKVKKEYREIYSCLNNEYLSIDDIVEKSRKNVREVINILSLMEIEGLVEFELGRGYRRK